MHNIKLDKMWVDLYTCAFTVVELIQTGVFVKWNNEVCIYSQEC